MVREEIFSFLSQGSEDQGEMEIPHPIHLAWAGRPWPSGVDGSGFEFFFWVDVRMHDRDHSGDFGSVQNALQ
jgi:hypothetical protein